MNIVKPSRDLNLPPLPKKPFHSLIKKYIPAMLLSSLLGTYIDLFMVGKELYQFPIRPFQDIISINVIFTLAVLPIITGLILSMLEMWNKWWRSILIILLSLGMTVVEKNRRKLASLFIPINGTILIPLWDIVYFLSSSILFIARSII